MTTDRPYHTAVDEHSAIAELQRCAGSQFDPDVVERFCHILATETTTELRAA
jgi:response regulator RpfG family c-di-GMP phosphodiesterase